MTSQNMVDTGGPWGTLSNGLLKKLNIKNGHRFCANVVTFENSNIGDKSFENVQQSQFRGEDHVGNDLQRLSDLLKSVKSNRHCIIFLEPTIASIIVIAQNFDLAATQLCRAYEDSKIGTYSPYGTMFHLPAFWKEIHGEEIIGPRFTNLYILFTKSDKGFWRFFVLFENSGVPKSNELRFACMSPNGHPRFLSIHAFIDYFIERLKIGDTLILQTLAFDFIATMGSIEYEGVNKVHEWVPLLKFQLMKFTDAMARAHEWKSRLERLHATKYIHRWWPTSRMHAAEDKLDFEERKAMKRIELRYEEEFDSYRCENIIEDKVNIWHAQTALRKYIQAASYISLKQLISVQLFDSVQVVSVAKDLLDEIVEINTEMDGIYSIMYNELSAGATDLSIIWNRKADRLVDRTASETHMAMFITVLAGIFLPLNLFTSAFGMNIRQLQSAPEDLPQWWMALVVSLGGTIVLLAICALVVRVWYERKWQRFLQKLNYQDRPLPTEQGSTFFETYRDRFTELVRHTTTRIFKPRPSDLELGSHPDVKPEDTKRQTRTHAGFGLRGTVAPTIPSKTSFHGRRAFY